VKRKEKCKATLDLYRGQIVDTTKYVSIDFKGRGGKQKVLGGEMT
jgi:hypothetical protein